MPTSPDISFAKKTFADIDHAYVTSYAQDLEDIILWRMLSHIPNGNYVDVGCADPNVISVTRLFYEKGWRGINIDPRSDAIKAHDNYRPEDINLCYAVSNKHGVFPFWEMGMGSTFDIGTAKRIGEEKFKKTKKQMVLLTDLLDIHQGQEPIHFIKIDVEKHEKEVLEGLDLKAYRPWVFAIECTLPGTGIPCWDAWESYLLNNGYKFFLMHGINRYYVSDEKFDEISRQYHRNEFMLYMPNNHKRLLHDAHEAVKRVLLDDLIRETDPLAEGTEPPRHPPAELKNRYTLNGKIPYKEWYLNETVSAPIKFTAQIYNATLNAIKNKTFKYYGPTLTYIQEALKAFPIEGKTVMVAGLAGCNCDAIAIHAGAKKVVAVDYNPPVCEHPLVESLGLEEESKKGYKYDAAFSISSYGHDGLGRYGDPLDPDADLKTMAELRTKMAPDGILFLAVETGPDYMVFNAGRLYGPIRYPMLIEGWGFLAAFGAQPDIFSTKPGEFGRQPVLVLSANPNALNIPESATNLQRSQIKALADHGAFDRAYYIRNNPDILTGKTDPVSHYVLYGAAEGRRPAPWFNAEEYMKAHPSIPWHLVNPFLHYLRPQIFKFAS